VRASSLLFYDCRKIPPMVSDYTLIEVSVRGLGLHNLYLRLSIRVMS